MNLPPDHPLLSDDRIQALMGTKRLAIFDERQFIHLVRNSISLTYEEKRRVFEAVPRLQQNQIDELFDIFREEVEKFRELEEEFAEGVSRLEDARLRELSQIATAEKEGELDQLLDQVEGGL